MINKRKGKEIYNKHIKGGNREKIENNEENKEKRKRLKEKGKYRSKE